MDDLEAFSPDYATARRRFRDAAERLGWETRAFPIGADDESGEAFVVDVAISQAVAGGRTLVASSGLHGVEGFFGSAVQLSMMERWIATGAPKTRCVFVHALNPFGFAKIRRADAENVDPNRNFLLPGERFQGAPARYADLDPLLNPPYTPRLVDGFLWKALWAVMRYGMPALKQAVAEGQYEFEDGLFFGGKEPCGTQRLLEKKLAEWLAGASEVVHLDFHTGLGGYGTGQLLLDAVPTEEQKAWLRERFGAGSFVGPTNPGAAYLTRGSIGRWLVQRKFAPSYLYLCAEFGTYSPLRVLSALRAENQADRCGEADSPSTRRAKNGLREAFCPASPTWRKRSIAGGLDLIERAVGGLETDRDAGGSISAA